jgi:hypothetical protein
MQNEIFISQYVEHSFMLLKCLFGFTFAHCLIYDYEESNKSHQKEESYKLIYCGFNMSLHYLYVKQTRF